MGESRVEQVRAIMPPDGTDFTAVFGRDGTGIDTGGLVAPDATVRFVAPSAETSASGAGGFRDTWADWLEAWESYRIYFDDVFEKGDSVVMLTRLVGVTKRVGVELEQEAAAVFRFEGEQIVELEFNLDREDALAD